MEVTVYVTTIGMRIVYEKGRLCDISTEEARRLGIPYKLKVKGELKFKEK